MYTYLENKVKIASLGGIEVIVSAMKTHSGHEGVQQQGCGALLNLAAHIGKDVPSKRYASLQSYIAFIHLILSGRMNSLSFCFMTG